MSVRRLLLLLTPKMGVHLESGRLDFGKDREDSPEKGSLLIAIPSNLKIPSNPKMLPYLAIRRGAVDLLDGLTQKNASFSSHVTSTCHEVSVSDSRGVGCRFTHGGHVATESGPTQRILQYPGTVFLSLLCTK